MGRRMAHPDYGEDCQCRIVQGITAPAGKRRLHTDDREDVNIIEGWRHTEAMFGVEHPHCESRGATISKNGNMHPRKVVVSSTFTGI